MAILYAFVKKKYALIISAGKKKFYSVYPVLSSLPLYWTPEVKVTRCIVA